MKRARPGNLKVFVVVSVICVAGGVAAGGVAYPDPPGGWTYEYTGDAASGGENYNALDGSWSHDNGSDQWDESAIGTGTPGGVSALGGYIRLQETGDPTDYGIGDPSNRKLMFGHSITDDVDAIGQTILDDGVTISFRARLSTSPPLDELHPNGGGGIAPWPAGGDGYVTHSGGKGNLGVRQINGSKLVSFCLALASDDDDISQNGLVMNKLFGTSPSSNVDLDGETGGIINILPIADMTVWREFWITIEADTTGTGTHLVGIYIDGSTTPEQFYVTAGTGSDYSDSYLEMGMGSTSQSGAFDVDFFAYALGAIAPSGGNRPPDVDAGVNQQTMLPINYVELNGTVEDDGLGEPNGFLEITWSKDSGPGVVTFEPNEFVEDPNARFSAAGEYVLKLSAWDGELDTNDVVTITVIEPDCPIGDLNNDCIVDFKDVLIFVGPWMTDPVHSGFGYPDLDGSDLVNMGDFGLLSQNWFEKWLGSLQVTISPQGAINDGAKWRRVGESTWRDSGVSGREDDLQAGLYTVDFKPIAGWTLPDSNMVEIVKGQTTATSGTYTELPPFLLIISEFMANKGSSLATTVSGETVRPDWIEIYNGTGETINLEGWYLTDSKNNLTKWRFPSMTINHDQYRVVFASEKEQKYYPANYPYEDDSGNYHTNFQLDRGGEYLALVKPDGLTIAHEYAPKYPQQYGFISYGRSRSGDKDGYFLNPTHGTQNDATCITNVVEDTKFDPDRGFYDSQIDVAITCATPGATIRYTTDGSEPTMSNGSTYSSKIYIDETTCLRAAAFKDGYIPTNVDTQTYIFLDDVRHQPNNPLGFPSSGWGHDGPDYEVDPHVVGDSDDYSGTYRNSFKDDMNSVPTVSLVMDVDDWFNNSTNMDIGGIYSNPGWENYDPAEYPRSERPVSAEFFDPRGGLGEFHINAVVRICGGSSTGGWKSDKLSMRLKFREPYGPTKLNFPVFGEDADAADSFDTLVLDARLNNAWNYKKGTDQNLRAQYTRDQFTSDIQNAMGGYGHHGQHVHLYLNGLYWGLYNFHERPDDTFAASYFGGNKKDYHVLKHSRNNVVSGSNANYLEMFSIANAGLSSDVQYQLIQQYLDVPNFIDYMITNFYVGNTDWAHHNWYATRNIYDPAGRWRYHSWDAEKGMQTLSYDATGKTNDNGDPTYLHQKLKQNAEYRMLFADHVHRHFFNDGILTVANATALYQHRLDVVDRAVVGESARWGDNRIDFSGSDGIRYTRGHSVYDPSGTWIDERDWLLGTYFPQRRGKVLNDQFKPKGLYPSIEAPVFDPNGGWDLTGFDVTVTAPGTILYTTDGNDPRMPGGSPNPDAETYSSAIHIEATTNLKARTKSGSSWSALNEAVYAVGPVVENLRITEIMYHPQDTNDPNDPNEEFIELTNIGPDTINLNLVRFTNGVDFTFPDIELEPNNFILVVKDQNAFEAQYGTDCNTAGVYSGRLENAGERIELEDAAGRPILNFRYKDGWYDVTDGGGFSLTIRDACDIDPCDWYLKSSWGASTYWGGSPGEADMGPKVGDIIINEILANSDTLPYDWVELYNPTDKTIDIGGWWLSDSGSEPNLIKYQIPENTMLVPDQYKVFTEAQFGDQNDPNCHVAFALSGNGETLYLSSGIPGELTLTGFRDERDFRASDPDVAFGLYIKSTLAALAGDPTDFVAMSQNTENSANIYPPKVGPIVIAEIMYHPEGSDDPELEYIKLVNISDSNVTLQEFDPNEGNIQWKFTDGIRYTFDPNTTIDANDSINNYIYVVYDPVEFASAYPGVPLGKIFGPFEDNDESERTKLSNGGEDVELSKPGDKDETTDERFYILVDRVNYDDEYPWPTEPDGSGKSLKRKVLDEFGNDPNNWQAAPPSPE